MSSASESLYREVATKVRDRITTAVYALGSKLPTEVELAEELGVNRMTVNRALAVLRAEGWVRVHRGVGTFVRDFLPVTRETPDRFSRARRELGGARDVLAGEVAEQDLSYDTRTVIERVRPPQEVADLLEVRAEEVSVVMRVRYVSVKAGPAGRTVPYQIAITYMPLSSAKGTAIDDAGAEGASSQLAKHDHALGEVDELVEVRRPEPEEAEFLALNEDQRVYGILRLGAGWNGRIEEVTTFAIPTHLARLRYRVRLED